MAEGRWIKLYEKLVESPMWQRLSGEQCKALVGFMLKVNWQEGRHFCAYCKEEIRVPPGATTKSYHTLAELSNVKPGVMKRLLKALVSEDFMDNQSRPRCHALYVIKNWEHYQSDEGPCNPPATKHGRPSRSDLVNAVSGVTSGPVTKNQKKNQKQTPVEALKIAKAYRAAQSANGQHLSGTNEAWAKELDKVHRLDGADWSLVREVLMWVTTDTERRGSWDGWQDKVRSLANLRTLRDGESKWSKILSSYMRRNKAQGQQCDMGTIIVDAEEADRQARELGFPLGED